MSLLRSRCGWLATVVTILCSLWSAAPAVALPIGDYNVATIDNSSVFDASSGLTYSNFQFYLGGADRSLFTLSLLEDGVRLTGPMSVTNGATAEFYFSYEVSMLPGSVGPSGVSFFAPSEISGDGFLNFVKTGKQVYEGPTPSSYHQDTLATLTTRNFDGEYSELANASFAPTIHLSVLDGARLSSAGAGNTATLLELTNRFTGFTPIPEPTTVALVALGLSGFAFARRRSR
jgi:hypothetical protein